jgi:hypothetical protein
MRFLINNAELNGKQDKLTFDSTPTSGSDNSVKSGAIYAAIQAAINSAVAQNTAKYFDCSPGETYADLSLYNLLTSNLGSNGTNLMILYNSNGASTYASSLPETTGGIAIAYGGSARFTIIYFSAYKKTLTIGYVWNSTSISWRPVYSPVLLWTNGSPTSAWTDTTLSIDLSAYNGIEVYYKVDGFMQSQRIYKSMQAALTGINSKSFITYTCQVYANDTSVRIYDPKYHDPDNAASTTEAFIPYQIFGF